MKQIPRIASMALVLAVSVPATAGQYYLDLFVGPNRTDETSFGVLSTSRIETDFDTGMNYGIGAGYDFGDRWRAEGELMRREADVDSHKLNMGASIPGSAGEANSTSLFANAFYDFANKTRVTPYAGAGLGMVMVDYVNFGVPGLDALDDDDDVMGFQLIGGLAVKINDRWDFRTDFRLLETEDADVTSSVATASTRSEVEYSSIDMTAGVRIRF